MSALRPSKKSGSTSFQHNTLHVHSSSSTKNGVEKSKLTHFGLFFLGIILFTSGYFIGQKQKPKSEPLPALTALELADSKYAYQEKLKEQKEKNKEVDLTFYQALLAKEETPKSAYGIKNNKEKDSFHTSTTEINTPSMTQTQKNTDVQQKEKEPPHTGHFSLQLSAFKTEEEAQAYLSFLKLKGIHANIQKQTINGTQTPWFRVLVGTYKTEEEAHQMRQLLQEKHKIKSTLKKY